MFLSDLAIKRPTVTVVTMLALVIFGIFALWSLKVDEFPDVAEPVLAVSIVYARASPEPVIAVSIVYPGASPEGVERELLDPIEEAISGASGIDKMQSKALDGFAQIIVFWHFDKDLNEASQDIRDAISKIRDDLPPEMKEPVLSSFDPGEMPIVSVILSSQTLAASELTGVADPDMVKELRAVAGVADVRLQGKVEREMTIELEPQKLDAAGVTVADVVQATQSQNLAAPVGRVNDALSERTIRLKGRLDDASGLDQVVDARGG